MKSNNITVVKCFTPVLRFVSVLLLALSGSTFTYAQDDCSVAAKELYNRGEYSAAANMFSSCLGDDPLADGYELYIRSLYLSGDLTRSWDLVSVIPDSLFNEGFHSIKARISFSRGDYTEAYTQYFILDSLRPGNLNYIKQLAICYDKLDSVTKSIEFYARAFNMNNRDIVSGMRLAEKYFLLDSLEMADSVTAQMIKADSIPLLLNLRGNILYRMKDYRGAYDCFVPLLREGTSDHDLLKKAGASCYALGETESALSMLSTAYLIKPDDELTCYYLAMVYQSLADYKNSELYFNAAIRNGISVNMANYYHRMAEMYETSGKYKEAIACYKKALEYRDDPESFKPELYSEIGRIYDVYFEDRKNAIYYYNKFLENYPDTTAYKYHGIYNRKTYLESGED